MLDDGRMASTSGRILTTSDAGSLYLVEEAEDGGDPRLRFRLAQNDSLGDLPVPNFTLPFDESSIAGSAATTLEPLILDDAYEIPESATYSFNRGFDEKFGYRAKSMLVVPMMDHQRTVVGVDKGCSRNIVVAVHRSTVTAVEPGSVRMECDQVCEWTALDVRMARSGRWIIRSLTVAAR